MCVKAKAQYGSLVIVDWDLLDYLTCGLTVLLAPSYAEQLRRDNAKRQKTEAKRRARKEEAERARNRGHVSSPIEYPDWRTAYNAVYYRVD